jgi:hypothetical protein
MEAQDSNQSTHYPNLDAHHKENNSKTVETVIRKHSTPPNLEFNPDK